MWITWERLGGANVDHQHWERLGQQGSEISKNPKVERGGQYNAVFVLNVYPNGGFRPLGGKSEVFKKVDFFLIFEPPDTRFCALRQLPSLPSPAWLLCQAVLWTANCGSGGGRSLRRATICGARGVLWRKTFSLHCKHLSTLYAYLACCSF